MLSVWLKWVNSFMLYVFPFLNSSAYCVCWICCGFCKTTVLHFCPRCFLKKNKTWSCTSNKIYQFLHCPWVRLNSGLTRFNNLSIYGNSISQVSYLDGSAERMTRGIQNADSDPDDIREVMMRSYPGEKVQGSGYAQTSLWVLLVPELFLNLSHNLSGTRIELLSNGKVNRLVV